MLHLLVAVFSIAAVNMVSLLTIAFSIKSLSIALTARRNLEKFTAENGFP